jgi:predicted enzyme related to lactoylglutathione lyase
MKYESNNSSKGLIYPSKKVVALGGKIVTPETTQVQDFRTCFNYPTGNIFGLWEEVYNSSKK